MRTVLLLVLCSPLLGCRPNLKKPDGGIPATFTPGTGLYWQLENTVDLTHPKPVFDIDMFDAAPAGSYLLEANGSRISIPTGANAGAVDRLHAQGKRVVCYFDTGAYESYRPDAALFPSAVIGNNTGWTGENWLDLRQSSWPQFESIILARMDLAARMGCDGVEGDQNNPMANNPGFPILISDEVAWYEEMARQVHQRNLAAIMKNGVEVLAAPSAPTVVALYEGALNEQCNQYSECGGYQQFVTLNKVVWNVEYSVSASAFCPSDNAANLDGYFSNNPPNGTTWQPCR